jgi:hypothetical protein
MIGGSLAYGLGVNREQTFAALLPKQLSLATGRNIELYNEGQLWGFGYGKITLNFHMRDVMAARPDLILWIISPSEIVSDGPAFVDIEGPKVNPKESSVPRTPRNLRELFWTNLKADLASKSASNTLRAILNKSRSVLLLRHLFYQSNSLYLKASLAGGNGELLSAGSSEKMQVRMQHLGVLAGDIEAQAKLANVPLVAVLVPHREQAALISGRGLPDGFDPFKLDDAIRAVLASHGAIPMDICRGFSSIPESEQYFFPVDGHPDAQGHAIISKLLAKELTSGVIPSLKAAHPTNSASSETR